MNPDRFLRSPRFVIGWLILMLLAVLLGLVGSIMQDDTSSIVAESMRVVAIFVLFRGLLHRDAGAWVVRFQPTLLWIGGLIWVTAVSINLWDKGRLAQGIGFAAVVTMALVVIQRLRTPQTTPEDR